MTDFTCALDRQAATRLLEVFKACKDWTNAGKDLRPLQQLRLGLDTHNGQDALTLTGTDRIVAVRHAIPVSDLIAPDLDGEFTTDIGVGIHHTDAARIGKAFTPRSFPKTGAALTMQFTAGLLRVSDQSGVEATATDLDLDFPNIDPLISRAVTTYRDAANGGGNAAALNVNAVACLRRAAREVNVHPSAPGKPALVTATRQDDMVGIIMPVRSDGPTAVFEGFPGVDAEVAA